MTPNILIVEAPFYPHISRMLLDGATAALEKGGAHFDRVTVTGALEIAPAIQFAVKGGEHGGKTYEGFVALGCVIRGDTYHFEIVAGESARALMDLGINYRLCVGNGILTVENEQQAVERADRGQRDKGGDAARACLSLIDLRHRLGVNR
ncbi:MAG: 6,7-dimethyl-8-ribityllumazine synthase [Alphaproteobacteria bacterium]|nr:6,7-dimethyl-8-ribityllumazine synthase [Alphaproteobacteria bacterium]MDE1985226.1 6,7-dimethyl-8-ribityllumazine synthase [Alphaproteobacteria bacterium]MDE2162565.1 6,7-dimethyl-8-ribityllumazine synthase [Alphaproteobacteria bacterium]MDE2264983.1 6,7-dimethyl-8-ribityllumazine synthase [Alphaproteobacteria bacterium]MDE2500777.1 6,7-dimethyl-8-ribityllumazine synthase [Alphaproteobacteria bacterium]